MFCWSFENGWRGVVLNFLWCFWNDFIVLVWCWLELGWCFFGCWD